MIMNMIMCFYKSHIYIIIFPRILRPRITSCDLRVILFQKKIIIINKKVKSTKIVSIPVGR